MLGGQSLIQRTEIPHPEAPDSFLIIAADPDGEAYTQHYFDSRGVVRVYAMTTGDGVWKPLRDTAGSTPLSFSQRFEGTFSAGGDRIDGRWERSRAGSGWELD